MATTPATTASPAGGAFLLQDSRPEEIFTPEDFTEEHHQTVAMANEFLDNEVLPQVEEYEQKNERLAKDLMRKAADLGLLGILVPEKFGGLEMDMTTQLIAAEIVGRYASFSTTYGAHSGIGTLPLVYFGNEEQKSRYLPKLVRAEMLAAYCLSESHAGSDALAARTRAGLSPDGKHYVLNGEKMWISNGGWADLYTVFAKIGGEKFTAFLVERAYPGVRPGAEERKMGIHGSSTTPLILEDARVPVENVLGEIGRGHIIAFNILNIGRLKLGVACVGGAKEVLAETIRYAKQRKAFGRAIADFGLIRHKLARSAALLYMTESLVYRTSGMIGQRMEGLSWDDADASQNALAAIEEYAVECSIAKVFGSEMLDVAVDEGVQIHGGYGFHQDYMVERAYRDSRINRIFEGTNEINRLLTTEMLLKRAAKGRLPLLEAVQKAAQTTGDSQPSRQNGPLAEEARHIPALKEGFLLAAGAAWQRFGAGLEEQQSVVAALSDITMVIFAAESAVLRARKRGSESAASMARLAVWEACATALRSGAVILGASLADEAQSRAWQRFQRLSAPPLWDVPAIEDRLAQHLIQAGRYSA